MDIINMSQKKFKTLKPLILPEAVISTECNLFNYKFHGKDMLIKKLFCHDGISFANKLYTLQAIDANREYIPSYFIIPECLISIDKRIEAFLINYIKGINLSVILSNSNVSLEEKKFYLKSIGQILEQMKNIRKYTPLKDFYIGDLNEDNLIVDACKKEIYVVDFDSCKMEGNKSSWC